MSGNASPLFLPPGPTGSLALVTWGSQPSLWEVLLTRGPHWAEQLCRQNSVTTVPEPRERNTLAENRPSTRCLYPAFSCSTKSKAAKLRGGKSGFHLFLRAQF